MTIYDISTPIMNNAMEPVSSKIEYINYRKGALLLGLEGLICKGKPMKTIWNFLLFLIGVKRITYKDFPDKMGLSWENIETMSHRGTHVDAPSHYGPTCNGKPAKTCSELPLEWFFNDGVLLDMRHKKSGEIISIDDIKEEMGNIDYKVKKNDIVLFQTGMDKQWNNPSYLTGSPGISPDAVEWLLLQGVKVIGIDSYSLDLSAVEMVRAYHKDKNNNHLWPVHMLGRRMEYCHIEKLANLDALPAKKGFKVCSFPVHIEKASAGWCRTVAIFN